MLPKNILSLLFVLVLLNACSASGPKKKSATAVPSKKSKVKVQDTRDTSLNGTKWMLEVLHGQSPFPGSKEITLHFSTDVLKGSTGCNSYSGPYKKMLGGTCKIGKIMLTEQSCASEKAKAQEDKIIRALHNSSFCDLSNGKLFLKDAEDGKILAVFTEKDEDMQGEDALPPNTLQKQEEEQDLQGTSWKVQSFSNGLGGRTHVLSRRWVLTAKFDDQGGLSGSGGCNRYAAAYKASAADRSFSFEMIKMTTEQCYPERIMAQEVSFMAALYTAASYRIQGDTLTLEDATGNAAVIFHRQ